MVKVAIVCEGKNDRDFFKKLIAHLGFSESNISFYILGGKSKFFELANKKYQDIKLEVDSGQIDNILFVVDADDEKSDMKNGGYENTQRALNALISELGFDAISKTYVMCDPATQTGYLESLILSTISEKQRNCIACFLACSEFESKENHKAILNQIYDLAYPNAPFDFEHENFDELKQMLINLFAGKSEAV
jgi:hypothetical protein